MSVPVFLKDLSVPEKRLLNLMQRINFGRIRSLRIKDGQPHFDPLPRTQRDYKFGGKNGQRPEALLPDFVLCKEQVELIQAIRAMQEGTIVNLEIRGGLPAVMTDEIVAA